MSVCTNLAEAEEVGKLKGKLTSQCCSFADAISSLVAERLDFGIFLPIVANDNRMLGRRRGRRGEELLIF